MPDPQPEQQPALTPPNLTGRPSPLAIWSFGDWFWFILKNLIGWLLILMAGPIGILLPGPGGLPLFIIGFGLITFPGKRRLTARVLRGRPVRRDSAAYQFTLAAVAVLVPGGVISWLFNKWWPFFDENTPKTLLLIIAYLSSVLLIWIFGLRGVHIINLALSTVARARRHVRPWLRKYGFDLLPPRRRWRLRHPNVQSEPDEEILEIHSRHRARIRQVWLRIRPWAIWVIRIAVVAGIFWWMLRPVYLKWDEVREPILNTNPWLFALSAAMFAFFLFAFRANAWRYILIGFGHRLPLAPSVRIWSFSELARYIPGVIWQVVGRVYLSRPYGVSGSVSSASQVLELCIFMLANIIVALACLAAAGFRTIPADQRHWLYVALAFVPALMTLMHPRVFYGLLNKLMEKLKKPQIEQALRKRELTVLTLWNILGLLWQALALWILTYSVLGLPIGKWYVLAGAYCLAWTIGFSVGFAMPGGIGVREFIFITTLQFILPRSWVQAHFPDPTVLPALAGFLGVLLRLWAMTGELLMAGISYLADFKGATNKPDAPGRVPAVPALDGGK